MKTRVRVVFKVRKIFIGTFFIVIKLV